MIKSRQSKRLVLFACLASVCLANSAVWCRAEDDSIKWHRSYAEVIRQAKLTQRPIFLEFRCAP